MFIKRVVLVQKKISPFSFRKKCLVNVIFFLFLVTINGYSQKPPNAKTVINRYLEAIGGKKKWVELKARISNEEVSLYQTNAPIPVAYKFMDYYKCFQAPNNYMDSWYEGLQFSILSESSDCKWLYYDKDLALMFLNKTRNKESSAYPRIQPLGTLNFQRMDSVILENNFYRIDFLDTDWNRVVSVYFDSESYLIKKHSYSNTGVDRHEYYYSDYREVNGYIEPYLMENYVDGKKYKTITVHRIEYNSEVNPLIFEAPVECKGEGTVHLQKGLPFPFTKD